MSARNPGAHDAGGPHRDRKRPDQLDRWDVARMAVAAIPSGRVVSYGDLGALLGTGPRQAGQFMGQHGTGLPWWRVVSHSGDLRKDLLERALPHWRSEGIDLKPNGRGCRIQHYRADLPSWADEVEAVSGWPPGGPDTVEVVDIPAP